METTFHNVTITIEAETPRDAYASLCNRLAIGGDVEWKTDTYTTEGDYEGDYEHHNTTDLMGR